MKEVQRKLDDCEVVRVEIQLLGRKITDQIEVHCGPRIGVGLLGAQMFLHPSSSVVVMGLEEPTSEKRVYVWDLSQDVLWMGRGLDPLSYLKRYGFVIDGNVLKKSPWEVAEIVINPNHERATVYSNWLMAQLSGNNRMTCSMLVLAN